MDGPNKQIYTHSLSVSGINWNVSPKMKLSKIDEYSSIDVVLMITSLIVIFYHRSDQFCCIDIYKNKYYINEPK